MIVLWQQCCQKDDNISNKHTEKFDQSDSSHGKWPNFFRDIMCAEFLMNNLIGADINECSRCKSIEDNNG